MPVGANIDLQLRRLREAQVDARRLIDATEAALAEDGETLLTPPERTAIQGRLYALADILETGDDQSYDVLLSITEELNAATQEFAARRRPKC